MTAGTERTISLLGVPLSFGAGSLGSDLGINAMRVSRIRGKSLVDHISAMGYNLVDRGDVEIVTPTTFDTVDRPRH